MIVNNKFKNAAKIFILEIQFYFVDGQKNVELLSVYSSGSQFHINQIKEAFKLRRLLQR